MPKEVVRLIQWHYRVGLRDNDFNSVTSSNISNGSTVAPQLFRLGTMSSCIVSFNPQRMLLSPGLCLETGRTGMLEDLRYWNQYHCDMSEDRQDEGLWDGGVRGSIFLWLTVKRNPIYNFPDWDFIPPTIGAWTYDTLLSSEISSTLFPSSFQAAAIYLSWYPSGSSQQLVPRISRDMDYSSRADHWRWCNCFYQADLAGKKREHAWKKGFHTLYGFHVQPARFCSWGSG